MKKKAEMLLTPILLIGILCAVAVLYLRLIGSVWFFNDDPSWIWAAATTTLKEILFSPERYRTMAPFFTPFLCVSFKIDWMLFGINPLGYYVHSLLSLCAAAVAFYLFLRLYITEKSALTGVLLFLINPVTLGITGWFSARHYIEGLFWALLSLYFFVKTERVGKVSLLSAAFYLLASLCKEVYVILPGVAFLLSKGSLLERGKKSLALWLGLLIYTLWRFWMMKGIGGYFDMRIDSHYLLPALCKIAGGIVSGPHKDFSALLYTLLSAAFIGAFASVRREHLLKVLLVFAILVVPIFPVIYKLADTTDGRYLFHLSIFLICVVCLFIEYPPARYRLVCRGAALLACLLVATVFIMHDGPMLRSVEGERVRSKEAAMRFLNAHEQYVKLEQFVGFYEPLRKIYREFFGRDIKTQLVPVEKALKYSDPEKIRAIRDSGVDIPYERILAFQKTLKDGPLTIRITVGNDKFTWDFGPDKSRPFSLLAGSTSGLYDANVNINPTGSMTVGNNPRDDAQDIHYVRVLYQTDNIEIISPEFVLKMPGNQKIEYIKTE